MADDFDLLTAQRRIFESGLRSPERLVLLALLDHWSTSNRYPHPSLNRLAKWTGFERTTVMRCLNSLLEQGVIKIAGQHRSGAKRSFDVRGVMGIAVAQSHRLQESTGCTESPVAESNPTGCTEPPEAVAESNPKEPREGTKEGTNGELVLEPPTSKPLDPVVEVFECWKADTGHTKAKLDDKRRARIKARLRDFSVEELQRAIRNRRNDPWLMGEDPRSPRVFDGLETLLRDTAQVERLRDLTERRAPRKTNGTPIRQHSGVDVTEGCETYEHAQP